MRALFGTAEQQPMRVAFMATDALEGHEGGAASDAGGDHHHLSIRFPLHLERCGVDAEQQAMRAVEEVKMAAAPWIQSPQSSREEEVKMVVALWIQPPRSLHKEE
uniref:Uncharacterized protein n=1 Tax=Oryza glumipatula TaxID=40148 RepID=A0A0D9Z886_9ORYZ